MGFGIGSMVVMSMIFCLSCLISWVLTFLACKIVCSIYLRLIGMLACGIAFQIPRKVSAK